MDQLKNLNKRNEIFNEYNKYVSDLDKNSLTKKWWDLFDSKKKFINWIIQLWNSFANVNNFFDFIDDIKSNNKVLYICWDYDADWICSTVLFSEFCDVIWIKYKPFIPNRIEDWYWLNYNTLSKIHSSGLWTDIKNNSIISLDSWVNNIDINSDLKELWINYYIIDHHQESITCLENKIDQSKFQINPHLLQNKMSHLLNEDNISTGLLVLMVWASYLNKSEDIAKATKFINLNSDLALITTVTDMMPVTWINRSLIKLFKDDFLKTDKLRKSFKTIFWDALQNWKILFDQEDYNSNDIHKFIWWTVWPIINSFWRISDPMIAYDYIKNWEWSLDKLYELNNYRKKITWDYRKEIESISIDELRSDSKYFLFQFDHSKLFTPGIQSILSWIFSNWYNKVVWIWYEKWDEIRYSFRCPKWINLKDIFLKSKFEYKWHNQAWVIYINKNELTNLKSFLSSNNFYREVEDKVEKNILPYRLTNTLINIKTINILNSFWPYWIWNPKPTFIVKWILMKQKLASWTWFIKYTAFWYEKIKILVGGKEMMMYNFWWRLTVNELFSCKHFVWTLERPFNEYSPIPVFMINKLIYV